MLKGTKFHRKTALTKKQITTVTDRLWRIYEQMASPVRWKRIVYNKDLNSMVHVDHLRFIDSDTRHS